MALAHFLRLQDEIALASGELLRVHSFPSVVDDDQLTDARSDVESGVKRAHWMPSYLHWEQRTSLPRRACDFSSCQTGAKEEKEGERRGDHDGKGSWIRRLRSGPRASRVQI